MTNLIPIIAILCAVGLPVVAIIVLILRLTSSTGKERMAMINKGMIPPEKIEYTPSRLRTLRTGMGAIGAGVGAIASVIALDAFGITDELDQMLIVLGTTFFFFGLRFIIYYAISKDKLDPEE